MARKPVPRWVPASRTSVGEVVGGLLAQLVGDQAEAQRADEVRLGVGYDVAVGVEELGAPGAATCG